MMRIITGKARGVRLSAPAGERTRPTAERAKQAIFSMLQFEIEDRRVLDLFAGSGQMGLEAVSRGAAHAVLVDSDRAAAECIRSNCQKTKLADDCEVISADAMAFLNQSRNRRRFDLVFLDPPYPLRLLPQILRMLSETDVLVLGGTVVCESERAEDVFGADEALAERYELLRQTHYGIACVTLLRLKGEAI